MKKYILTIAAIFCFLYVPAQVTERITVTGVITDEAGKPTPGVAINITGIDEEFYTNEKGFYSVKGPKKSLITYSLDGHVPVTFSIRKPKEINVTMYKVTGEMVNVGYGKQKKENVVGSVREVSGEELRRNMGGSTNIMDGLEGIPGVSR